MFFGKLKLQNRPVFKGPVEFDFGYVGLTVIHGLNTNGANASSSNPNAAGKSALFNSLQDLLYPEVLVGSRRDRVTEGSVSLEMGTDRKSVHRLVSKDKKQAIFKGKHDLVYREVAEVQSFVRGIIPQSLVAYATLCHIDDRIPHPLTRGETAARREFFTKFFELDSTDYRRKLISARITDIRASARLMEDKKSRLAALPTEVADLGAFKRRMSKLQERKDSLQASIDSFNEDAALRHFLKEHASDLKDVPDLAKLKAKVTRLEATLERIDEDAEFQANLASWRKQEERHAAYMRKHSIQLEERAQVLSFIEEYQDRKSEAAEFKRIIQRVGYDLEELAHPETAEGVCDACGAELTGKLKAQHEATHQAAVDRFKKKRSALKLTGREAKEKLEAIEQQSKDMPSLSDAKARLEILDNVPRTEVMPKRARQTDEDLPARTTVVEKLRGARSILDTYQWARGSLYARASAMDNVSAFLAQEDPTSAYLSTVESLATLGMDYEIAKRQEKERVDLAEDIANAEEEIRNAEALELLERAYGPRGFRRVLINTVCQQLEGVLNRYSKVLYPEDYNFELELDKQFHILVTRKVGDKEQPSDVRRLSGAESSMFSILLWCGLMSFVPKAMRPNMLILDEVDARLGDDMRERFLAFIPKMLKVVEHVIIVTPRTETRYEDYIPEARYLTVVKRGLNSTIMPGKATEQK
jgi:hypothetical protein